MRSTLTNRNDSELPKIGIILPLGEGRMDGETARWSDLLAMSQRAEELGFDSVWLVDHLLVKSDFPSSHGVWECWSLLSALAASTSRVDLGTLVLCNSFRNPALLSKMAETVDEISNGRLVLGLGAGHHKPEFDAYGFPFDHRVSRFEEAIQIITSLLREGRVDFEGDYYSARNCELRPRGPRPAGPPIMIGTSGPRMLEITARYADNWNVYFDKIENSVAGYKQVSDQLDAACEHVGRDPATINRSVSIIIGVDGRTSVPGVAAPILTGSNEEIAAEMRAYAAAGADHIQVRSEPNTVEGIERLAEVVDHLRNG
jgi:alkanesulfonate monooxygenase SsuD/methylene tetrahydromethanopterin reductase-like flavin-dependent oxidoreductase (luciferase family)